MKSTGYKDSDGKLIRDGDILEVGSRLRGMRNSHCI
jgi:hypothetical protein